MKTYVIYALSWLGMVVLAILNGIVRTNVYGPHMRELSAHQLSTVVFMLFIGLYTFVMTGLVRIESGRQALQIGGMWLCMTVAFEFLFGHYVVGHSWGRLFNDYNLLQGRVWVLILIWTVAAPYTLYRIRS